MVGYSNTEVGKTTSVHLALDFLSDADGFSSPLLNIEVGFSRRSSLLLESLYLNYMPTLRPTDIIHGKITRISNSGNGVLDYGSGEISIGAVRPEVIGQEVDAVVYDEDHAFCLDESVQLEYYDNTRKAQTGQLLDNPPSDCPGLGDEIDVEVDGINSSRHGPATYRGIPVRVRNIPEGVSVGETLPVKVYRIEPQRLVATGLTDISIRSNLPDIGDRFSAKITHRTHSGRGLVEGFVDHTINIGPVRSDAVGETVDVILLNEDWGYCVTDSFTDEGYDEAMAPHVSDVGYTLEELSRKREAREGQMRDSVGRIVRGEQTRRSRFRNQVIEAYDGACAVCGQRIQDANSGGYFEVEAAHIYPVSGIEVDDSLEGGPDTVRNGLALCRTHHWVFDNGWFTITDDYTIKVRDDTSTPGFEQIQQYDEKQLILPDDGSTWPAKHYLEAHRNKVWTGR